MTGDYPELRRPRLTPEHDPERHAREIKALLWLVTRGHRDIAIILGLLPDGGEQ